MIDRALYEPIEKSLQQLFTYEQRWFFINGIRATGKTYTLMKLLLQQCLKDGEKEIGYVMRTDKEYLAGGVMDGFQKVLMNEFPDLQIEEICNDLYLVDKSGKRRLVKGFPLSQAFKIKRKAFPTVKYLLFDEYMIESGSLARYVNGYKEPDLLLSLYETIDRRSNTVRVFLLGNNTNYYNPYHVHRAFSSCFVRKPEEGGMNKAQNCVFWRIAPTPELKAALQENGFARMIDGTDYGRYASDGEYTDDVTSVEPMTPGCKTLFALKFGDQTIYVHQGMYGMDTYLWLSNRGDTGVRRFAVRANDVEKDVIVFKGSQWYEVFTTFYDNGRIFFSNQQTKTQCQDFLYCILSNYRKG